MELTVVDESGPGLRRFARVVVDGPIVGRRDLGTLVVARPPAWRYRLRDRAGAPIEGAEFIAVCDGERRGERERRTQSEGELGTIDPDADELLVTAAGFEPQFVALAGRDPAVVLDLVLERSRRVTVAIAPLRADARSAAAGDARSESWNVELVAPRSPFSAAALRSIGEWANSAGFSLTEWKDGAAGLRLLLHCDAARPFELEGLLPGVLFDLTLRDPLGERCGALLGVAATDEPREVVLVQQLPLRPLVATIVDEAGQPIEGAWLDVRAGDDAESGRCGGSSDAQGRVTTPAFAAIRGDVSVGAHGFVSTTWRDVALPAAGEERSFVLPRAVALAIELIDSAGEPIAPALREEVEAWVVVADQATSAAESIAAELDHHGNLLVPGLPHVAATVHLRFAGAEQQQPFDPHQPTVRFTLPATGQVVVRYDLPLPAAESAGRPLLAMTLEPLAGAAGVAGRPVSDTVLRFDPPQRTGSQYFPAVLPGRYRVVLRFGPADADHPLEALEREPTAVEVNVVAGEQSEVTVDR